MTFSGGTAVTQNATSFGKQLPQSVINKADMKIFDLVIISEYHLIKNFTIG